MDNILHISKYKSMCVWFFQKNFDILKLTKMIRNFFSETSYVIKRKVCEIMALDYTAIGLRIREYRLKKRLTQEDIANQMNVSIAFLSRIERGSARINLPRLSELCDILGVSEGEILNGTAPLRSNYLSKEFSRLLKVCPKDKLRILYEIAQVLIDEKPEPGIRKNSKNEEKPYTKVNKKNTKKSKKARK